MVEAKELPTKFAGCRGICPIPEALSYVSLNRLCVLPNMHILALGLAANFWGLVLRQVEKGTMRPDYVLSNKAKADLKSRGKELQLTADFGRPYM